MNATVVSVTDPILQATVRLVLMGKMNTPDVADVMADFFSGSMGYDITIHPVQNAPVLDEIEQMLAHEMLTKFAEFMSERRLH